MQQQEPSIKECRQYLGFTIGNEEYGVDILRVREIREWKQVRALPGTPKHVIGVLDLHGTIVPIVDLRKRFNQATIEYCSTTVIIVLAAETGTGQLLFGIVVDGVSEVLDIASAEIREPPDLDEEIIARYLNGMVTLNERMVILLDVDRIMKPEELAAL